MSRVVDSSWQWLGTATAAVSFPSASQHFAREQGKWTLDNAWISCSEKLPGMKVALWYKFCCYIVKKMWHWVDKENVNSVFLSNVPRSLL